MYSLMAQVPIVSYSKSVAAVRTWNHAEAVLPWGALLVASIAIGGSYIVALLAMVSFRPFSRWLLLFTFVASILVSPLTGLTVLAPLERFIGGISSTLVAVALAFSFLSPLARKFEGSGDSSDKPLQPTAREDARSG
jgi:hypothetical protein